MSTNLPGPNVVLGAIPAAFGASWQYKRVVPSDVSGFIAYTLGVFSDNSTPALDNFAGSAGAFSFNETTFNGVDSFSLAAQVGQETAAGQTLIFTLFGFAAAYALMDLTFSYGDDGGIVSVVGDDVIVTIVTSFAYAEGTSFSMFSGFAGESTIPATDVTVSADNGITSSYAVVYPQQLEFPVNPAIPYFRIVAAALDISYRVELEVQFLLGGVRQSTLTAYIGGDSPAPGSFFMNPPSKPLTATYFGSESGCGAFNNTSEDLLTNYIFCEWSALCDKVVFIPKKITKTGDETKGLVFGVLQIASR